MTKQAWRSYIASLHPRNLKKVNNDNHAQFFNLMWWLAIYPSIIAGEGRDSEIHWGVYMLYLTAKFLPILFMSWSNMCGRLPMPKMMYMAPMREEDRYAYIKSLMMIKITVPMGLSLVLLLIWNCFFEISVIQIVAILFVDLSIGIGDYVCSTLVNKHNRRIVAAMHNKEGEVKDAWLNNIVVFASMVVLVVLESTDFRGGIMDLDGSTFGVIVFVLILIGLLIGDIVIIKTRYKDTLDNLCNYEITHSVLGKVKNV